KQLTCANVCFDERLVCLDGVEIELVRILEFLQVNKRTCYERELFSRSRRVAVVIGDEGLVDRSRLLTAPGELEQLCPAQLASETIRPACRCTSPLEFCDCLSVAACHRTDLAKSQPGPDVLTLR